MHGWNSKVVQRFLTVGFVSVALVACSKANVSEQFASAAPESVIYPHSAEFKATNHGKAYLHDASSCSTCHNTRPSYPNSPTAQMTASDGSTGNTPPACTQCHSYPHTPLWALPGNHGATFAKALHASAAEKKPVGCTQCHDKTKEPQYQAAGMTTYPVSCDTCHVLMPHTEKFKMGGHKDIARTYQGGCVLCHSDLKTKYLPNQDGAGCYNCHDEGKIPTVKWLPIPAPAPSHAPVVAAPPAPVPPKGQH